MKTTLLLAGLVLAWGFVAAALPRSTRPAASACVRSLAAILAGVVVVPALIVGWVAMRGGLSAMRYDVVDHNLLPALGRTHGQDWRLLLMGGLLALLALVVRRRVRTAADPVLAARRSIVVASALAYTLLLFGTWPLLTRQDHLPSIPLLAIGAAAWWRARHRPRLAWLPIALAIAGLVSVLHKRLPWDDRLAPYRATLADVLATTASTDPVMDDKGAAIYRMRPYYFALEGITQARMQRGLIVDDIPQRLVATQTHVVWMERMPTRDSAFIAANYLPARNGLRVAGHDFGPVPAGAVRTVDVAIPGIYALSAAPAGAVALLDGTAYAAPRHLAAGRHRLTAADPARYALVWEPGATLVAPLGENP